MFNRQFFERDLMALMETYARDKGTEVPVVELVLRDSTRYYIESIELVGQSWLSFRAAPDPRNVGGETHRTPDQITCPYSLIARVDFVPQKKDSRVGFRLR
jgi:hypothetical protein